jgi:rfaE bifunctional protein nucleotidyltransferase chain/domain/rfaE bifunctional protein kinase chain/domain
VVVGDTILDVDLTGSAGRLCPDEPAPVLDDLWERRRPGGAALTAWLAARHGREVVLVCARADDEEAGVVEQLLAPHVRVLPLATTGSTAVKTRVRAGDRTLARLDRGGELGDLQVPLSQLRHLVSDAAAVLVSDYGRGVAAQPEVRMALTEAAWRVPVVWDPHPRGSAPVPDVTLATPNAAEAAAWVGRAKGSDLSAHLQHARALHQHWDCRHLAVTLGSDGAALVPARGTPLVVPARPVDARDTCGAGDAFAAAAAAALAVGASEAEAVQQAVEAAGAFVSAGAAAGLRFDGLVEAEPDALEPSPADSAAQDALATVERCRSAGGRVVVAGGCFDLLHAGHVEYLEAARRLGDCLVVAVNSDRSVRRLKGEGRPLVGQADRARLLRALSCVDAVVVFDEPTPAQVLARLRPDVFAKGGDYLGVELPEAAEMGRFGGEVVALPTLAGRSTTGLAQRLDPPVPTLTEEKKEHACSAL